MLGCNYGVAEGQFPDLENEGELEDRKVLVFVDPKTDKQYHFPLTEEQAVDIALKLEGGEVDTVIGRTKPPEPEPEEPSKADRVRLEAIERATQGGPLVGGKS